MTNAAIYARISQDRTGQGLGVARQEKDCRQLAESLGVDVVRVFADDDRSAYSGKPRPAYLDMLAAIEAGHVDAVLVWHTDRLTRSPRELEEYIALCDPRCVLTHSVTAGPVDLSTASGLLQARIAGAVAAHESHHKSERVRRKMRELTEAGAYTGGVVPFGWRIVDGVPVLVEEEAALVREATARFLAGESIGSLVRWLNGLGVRTRTGKQWAHIGLRQVLRRCKNAGVAVVEGEVVGPSMFPAIVTEDQWRAVMAITDDPARLTAQSARVKYLLSGLGRCGVCGDPMRSASVPERDGSIRKIYRCARGKGHPYRTITPIDDYVATAVVERLARPDVVTLFARDDTDELEALRGEREAIRAQMDDLAREFGDGNITASQMGIASRRLQERLDATSARLAARTTGSVVDEFIDSGVAADAWWEALPIERKRLVVDAVTSAVYMDRVGRGRGRTFHPDTVRIEWR